MKTAFSPERKPHVDERLILELAGGERRALAELYRQTDSAVYGFALSILKDPHAAEDVMQDTYLKILDSAQSYAPMGKPMAWILTITRNLAYQRLRRAKRETAAEDIPEEADHAILSEETENKMILETALKTLGEEERQIVMLHAVSGLKHREIAALLGLGLPTTLSRYHRALAKLQKQLGGMR